MAHQNPNARRGWGPDVVRAARTGWILLAWLMLLALVISSLSPAVFNV